MTHWSDAMDCYIADDGLPIPNDLPRDDEMTDLDHIAEQECPACKGDGRIPDKTGGGYHGTCKTCGGTGKVTK